MSAQPAPKHTPQVQHSFDGDVKVLNGTFTRRLEVRKALTTLAEDLQRFEGSASQVKAEIKLRTTGAESRQHVYSVTITDRAFKIDEFNKAFPPPPEVGSSTAESLMEAEKSHVNGQQEQTTPRTETCKADDEDVIEARSSKRLKTTDHTASPNSMAKEVASKEDSSGSAYRSDELLQFMKDWHEEWVRQGGWLFDNITKAVHAADGSRDLLQTKLDAVQDVLGQSMNSASASTMAELSNVSILSSSIFVVSRHLLTFPSIDVRSQSSCHGWSNVESQALTRCKLEKRSGVAVAPLSMIRQGESGKPLRKGSKRSWRSSERC